MTPACVSTSSCSQTTGQSLITQVPVFSRAELARITAPMLLLIGAYEQLYDPAATLARARRLKPDIAAELVPGADHIAAMAQPDWVNARLVAFLGGTPSRGAPQATA